MLVVRFEGYAVAEVGKLITSELDAFFANQERPIGVFDDWWGATGYDTPVRTDLTKWMEAHVANVSGVHILVRSKIVSMGIAVGSMMVGKAPIHTYSDRARWQAVVDEHIRPKRAAK